MNSSFFFSNELLSSDHLEDLEAIFYDAEGTFPSDQLEIFINNNNFDVEIFTEDLVQYAVFQGTEIANQDDFFSFIKSKVGTPSPKVWFWRCYDAILRGNLENFDKLWTQYSSMELKSYSKEFIVEAIIIPEDPVFLNVASIVHDHQQRLIKQFILPADTTKELADSEFDTLLQSHAGKYSILLSYFRLLQASFQRNIIFQDLDNLLTLLKVDNIAMLGPYWECRFLETICSWKASLGLVFDVVDNLNLFKNLNVEANNFLFESQIFLIEAQIAFKNNNFNESKELLQSALFLAKEYKFFYQVIAVLFAKFEIDTESLSDTVEELFSLTTEDHHPLLRAKMHANLGAYYIQQKNWSEAEKNLLSASRLVQGSYDKKTYYQVVADFSYVLVITGQLQEALEATRVLLDDNVSLLFRIRGFYLYALTLLLLNQKSEAIEILEEGIRIVISFKEHISLPWFYELLELIYLSLNDIETSIRYSNLGYKAYFDSSDTEHGYRSKLIGSYLLALQKDFGRSISQISGLLSEITDQELELESYSALQSIVIGSQESLDFSKFTAFETIIESHDNNSLIKTFVEVKNAVLMKKTVPKKLSYMKQIGKKLTFQENLLLMEHFLLVGIMNNQNEPMGEILPLYLEHLKNFLASISFSFIILNSLKNLIDKLLSVSQNSPKKISEILSEERDVLISASFLITILRLVIDNLPFNFLMQD